MALTLTSTAFSQGGDIPSRYTCEGEDTVLTGLNRLTKVGVEAAMAGHVIEQVELVGTYEKSR